MTARLDHDGDTRLHAIEDLIDEVVAAYFAPGRPSRSLAFRSGFVSALSLCALGRSPALPYDQGSAEHDAWFAGFEAGKQAWVSEAQALYLATLMRTRQGAAQG